MKTIELKLNAGSLNRRLSIDIALELTSLKLVGSLDSADILYLSNIIKNGIMKNLDLSSVRLYVEPRIENLFCDSKTLEKLKLPKSKGKSFFNSFNNCTNLKEIEIIVSEDEPNIVSCFNNCPQIKKISLKRSSAKFDLLHLEKSFDMVSGKSCDLYVPNDYQTDYVVARGWCKFNVRREKGFFKHIFQNIFLRNNNTSQVKFA